MAATSFTRSLITTAYPKYNDFLVGNEAYSPSVFELIETVTVGAGGSASITLGSGGTIPQTYKHLELRMLTRSSGAGLTDMFWRFNGDSGNNYYTYHYLYGTGTTYGSGGSNALPDRMLPTNYVPSTGQAADTFAVHIAQVLDYRNTSKYKVVRGLGGVDSNGSGWLALGSSNWLTTNAVTSITLALSNGTNFVQHSSISLYGMK